ncbi:hypothetical protein RJ640_023770 [Escallonia rubra]|uniref:Glycosyl transferase CAP10 domain-containing protein n=1 Tax=Escallonia rubra TaxID=112253 RepID=A0AA88UII9_9ASTE|nr:hypothetical protein RJ640_023770 [Escallonia rubra]
MELTKFFSKLSVEVPKKGPLTTATVLLIVIFIAAYTATSTSIQNALHNALGHGPQQHYEYPAMKCLPANGTRKCLVIKHQRRYKPAGEECPEYFRGIHEDLRPLKGKRITKELMESGRSWADIRIVVVDGKVYLQKFKEVFQTRDVFTLWGLLQLLRLYPGELPDLDLLISCDDRPAERKDDFGGENVTKAPPIFHYCGDDETLDVVSPDWSFWGW